MGRKRHHGRGPRLSQKDLLQAMAMQEIFPKFSMRRVGRAIIWVGGLTPTPRSQTYTVQITRAPGAPLKIEVLEPTLRLLDGYDRPEHTYEDGSLCLHYPPDRDWRPHKLIAKVIVPWIVEWLYNYEVWVETGEWCGGGVGHHGPKAQEESCATAS